MSNLMLTHNNNTMWEQWERSGNISGNRITINNYNELQEVFPHSHQYMSANRNHRRHILLRKTGANKYKIYLAQKHVGTVGKWEQCRLYQSTCGTYVVPTAVPTYAGGRRVIMKTPALDAEISHCIHGVIADE